MWHRALIVVSLAATTAAPALAQSRPPRLASVLSGLFGPNGLVVNSEAVLPNESPHSVHFNIAFQNFTQLNIGLASQLTSLPLPSPASGFTYRFDQSTGTFVRSTQSFGPILTDRAETSAADVSPSATTSNTSPSIDMMHTTSAASPPS